MQPTIRAAPNKCFRCIARPGLVSVSSAARPSARQQFSTSPLSQGEHDSKSRQSQNEDQDEESRRKQEPGAMSRRLAQMSEEGLEDSGRRAAKVVQEAGFDDELKRQLEERIKSASFRSENASAFAQANLPSSAGRGTRDIAGARAWHGEESIEDASLRMLNDSIKPLRAPARPPRTPSVRTPTSIDTGRSTSKTNSGSRIANARDKTSVYAAMRDMPENERDQFRKEMKERFTPAARSVPVTIRGIESLANERIEDAIARGKFKNLPRGQKIERDYNASSPFINTTEYLLNRMIQRQDIVPPWIEKQQELVSTATRFRGRIRADWRRHVARTISSRGGTLESRMALADEYAFAEAVYNPQKNKSEKLNTVDYSGQLSQITLAGELLPKETPTGNEVPQEITIKQDVISSTGEVVQSQREEHITIESDEPVAPSVESSQRVPTVHPFRDPQWLQTEISFQRLAVENLNSLTRSYNLMCPQLAQRPYFDLERELKACYADVAPQVAKEIRDRENAPSLKTQTYTSKQPSRLEKFTGSQARVYDEMKPQYGFKELLKDWFGRGKNTD